MIVDVKPEFRSEARILAKLLIIRLLPKTRLTDEPDDDIVEVLAEALQRAYELNH